MNQKVVGAFFFGTFVLVFGGIAVWDLKRSLEFLHASIETTGTLVTYQEDEMSQNRTPVPAHRFHKLISFTGENGDAIQARDPQMGLADPTGFDRPIRLRYLKRDPSQIRVVNNSLQLFTMSIVLGVAALLSIVGGVLFFRD